ncbi:MAG: hypothetical protein Q9223_003251 [Gallowayella weberi]
MPSSTQLSASLKPPPSPRPSKGTLPPPGYTNLPVLPGPPSQGQDSPRRPPRYESLPLLSVPRSQRPRLVIITELINYRPTASIPAPDYQRWHPTTVIFEYLHVRGIDIPSQIRIHERNEIGIPEPLLALCKWFNSVTRQAAMKESTVWKAHVDRVRWLKWYWEQTSPGLVNRFRELQEEAKQLIVFREKERKEREKEREERFKSLEARIADAMDIDVDEGVQDDDAEWQDRHDGVDGDDGKEWYERTVNAAGEDDPEGLTQEQWEIVEEIEATFGAEELVSAADVAVDRKLGDVIHQSWM